MSSSATAVVEAGRSTSACLMMQPVHSPERTYAGMLSEAYALAAGAQSPGQDPQL